MEIDSIRFYAQIIKNKIKIFFYIISVYFEGLSLGYERYFLLLLTALKKYKSFIEIYQIKHNKLKRMTTTAPAASGAINQRTYTQPIDSKNRLLGFSLIISEIGVMIGYGLAGQFRNESLGIDILRGQVLVLILLFIFIVMGFGLLLNIFRFGNWLGSSAAILTLATSIQLSPLLQKLFISIILTSFGGRTITAGTHVSSFWSYISNNNIDISTLLMRITFLSIISNMVVMTAVVGRVGIMQIVKLSSLFQIAWCSNFYLLIYFLIIYQDHNGGTYSPFFFDMFGTTYVYIFAVFFGIPFSCFLKNQYLPEVHPRNEFNRLSLLLSQIGTGILAATFVFSSCYVINYNTYGLAFGNNLGRFSIFFGIMGCVIGTFISSALFGRGRPGYKEVLVSTVCGGVVMGSAAPLIANIGVLIMIGAVTGIFCGIYMRVIHVKVNNKNVTDTLGLFGPFFISALFGSLVVTPAILATYYNRGQGFAFDSGVPIPMAVMGYQLVYLGLSAGIGLAGGLLTSLFSICDKDYFALASNSRIFLNEFGLYDLGQAAKSTQVLPPPSRTAIPNTPNQIYVGQDSNQGLNKSANLL